MCIVKSIIIVLIALVLCIQKVSGQSGAVELYSGLNKTAFTGNLIAGIDRSAKFNFIGMGFFNHYHRQKDQLYNETGIQAGVFYSFAPGFKVGMGLYANNTFGLQQRIVVNYTKQLGNLFLVVAPAFAINKHTETAELVIDFIYEKPLDEKWGLYAKMLGMVAYDNFDTHARNFIQPRFGVSHNKIQLGVFSDVDHWGSRFDKRVNFGIFVRKKL